MPLSRSAGAATAGLSRIRQKIMVAMGWTIVAIGVVVFPLPGPGGLPIILVGGLILLRNSDDAKRTFVRLRRRHPKFFQPIQRLRDHMRRRRRKD